MIFITHFPGELCYFYRFTRNDLGIPKPWNRMFTREDFQNARKRNDLIEVASQNGIDLRSALRHQRYEEEIRYQKEYYEALFLNNPVAVVSVDWDLNIVSWNPRAEKQFGYTQEEVSGQNLDDVVAQDTRAESER